MERDAKKAQESFRGSFRWLKEEKEVMRRWKEHFTGLLNGDAGKWELVKVEENEIQDVDGEFELEEVRRVVRNMKKGKAGGCVAYRQR